MGLKRVDIVNLTMGMAISILNILLRTTDFLMSRPLYYRFAIMDGCVLADILCLGVIWLKAGDGPLSYTTSSHKQ